MLRLLRYFAESDHKPFLMEADAQRTEADKKGGI